MKVIPGSTQVMYPNQFRPQEIQTGKEFRSMGKNDTVSISDQGRNMQAQASDCYADPSCMPGLFGAKASKDGVITYEEQKAFAKENMEKAAGLLMDTLKALGISGDQSVLLQKNSEGKIEITSDLPSDVHEKLEQSINENQEFVTAFKAGSFANAMIKINNDPGSAQGRFGVGQIATIHEFLISMEKGTAAHIRSIWPDGSWSDG
ncbi:hypothetical protein [uncultured Desulfobacter sp.]|uniref:hypothetical protein n=1 Tax=uncultured Desulfobacter sp. TaxID=240139 RepID=UPI0029F5C468|nr:hypothetical protein [uncultured Desulfobacter sp.]